MVARTSTSLLCSRVHYEAVIEVSQGSSTGIPVGTIIWYGASIPPNGWLECNGQSTAPYPALAAIVGVAVPDLRGKFIRGWDHSAGIDSSRVLNTIQNDAGRNIIGTIYGLPNAYYTGGNGAFSSYYIGGSDVGSGPNYVGNYTFDASRVWGSEHTAPEFRPINIALLPCIKY